MTCLQSKTSRTTRLVQLNNLTRMRDSLNFPKDLAIHPSQPPAALKPLLEGHLPSKAYDSTATLCTSIAPSSYVQDINGFGIAGRIWWVHSTNNAASMVGLTWDVREAAYLLPVYLCQARDDIVYDPPCPLQTRSKLLDSVEIKATPQVVIELGSVCTRPNPPSLGR